MEYSLNNSSEKLVASSSDRKKEICSLNVLVYEKRTETRIEYELNIELQTYGCRISQKPMML